MECNCVVLGTWSAKRFGQPPQARAALMTIRTTSTINIRIIMDIKGYEMCFRALLLMFAIKKSNYFLQPGSSQSPKIDHLSSPKSPQNSNKLNVNNSKNNNNNITMFPSSPFLQGPPGPQSLSGNISRIPLRIYPLMPMSD